MNYSIRKGDSCYLSCGGIYHRAFFKNGYEIIQCGKCGLLNLEWSRDYDSFLKEYYVEDYYRDTGNLYGYSDYLKEEKQIRKNAQTYLKLIEPYKRTGRLLDVGCAAGFFLDEAREYGFEVMGTDPSGYILSKAPEQLSGRLTEGPIHLTNFKQRSFDVITLFDVIEHLADPRADLIHLKHFLNKDGILVISTGDVDSLYSRILKQRSHFYAPPHHLFYFSRKTLEELLRQAGFAFQSVTTIGKWISYPYLALVSEHSGIPFLSDILNNRSIKRAFSGKDFYLKFGDSFLSVFKAV